MMEEYSDFVFYDLFVSHKQVIPVDLDKLYLYLPLHFEYHGYTDEVEYGILHLTWAIESFITGKMYYIAPPPIPAFIPLPVAVLILIDLETDQVETELRFG